MASKGEPEQEEGNVAADGAIAWKAVKFRREIGSAKTLDEPAIQVVRRVILRAVHKSTASVSIVPVISLEECRRVNTPTAPELSECTRTWCPAQESWNVMMARTMAATSIRVDPTEVTESEWTAGFTAKRSGTRM